MVRAADLQLAKVVDIPEAAEGELVTFTVSLTNAGPDEAVSAYPNSYHVPPMGLDVFVDEVGVVGVCLGIVWASLSTNA